MLITSGTVIVSITKGDNSIMIDSKTAGDVVGEISMLTGMARTASMRAKTGVEAVEIVYSCLQEAVEANPSMLNNLWKSAAVHMGVVLLSKEDNFKAWTKVRLREYLMEWELKKQETHSSVVLDRPLIFVHGRAAIRARTNNGEEKVTPIDVGALIRAQANSHVEFVIDTYILCPKMEDEHSDQIQCEPDPHIEEHKHLERRSSFHSLRMSNRGSFRAGTSNDSEEYARLSAASKWHRLQTKKWTQVIQVVQAERKMKTFRGNVGAV